jgi:hypothetical protein
VVGVAASTAADSAAVVLEAVEVAVVGFVVLPVIAVGFTAARRRGRAGRAWVAASMEGLMQTRTQGEVTATVIRLVTGIAILPETSLAVLVQVSRTVG